MPELISKVLNSTEFWAAIIGAIVGGLIALGAQMLALRAARQQREEDRKLVQQGLANSLLFKMIRITSNLNEIRKHVEEGFQIAAKEGGEPFQFVTPVANVPSPVHFTPEEMGMLLAQRDDDVFNLIAAKDDTHNSAMEILKQYADARHDLATRLPAPQAREGYATKGVMSKEEMLALQPFMIGTSSLVEGLKTSLETDAKVSAEALDRLHALLRKRGLVTFRLEPKGAQKKANSHPEPC